MKNNSYLGSSILTQNSKMKKTGKKYGVRLFNFGIPAYKTQSGKLTCPFAKDCVKFCYAQKGAYSWGNVKPAFEKRYLLTKDPEFIDIMTTAIKSVKADVIRIHDSGDFYSKKYLADMMSVVRNLPDVKFYFYTKSVGLIKQYDSAEGLPANAFYIFSYGGKQDDLINTECDRHAVIFDSLEDLQSAGYVDCSEYDLNALTTKKVGLIIH